MIPASKFELPTIFVLFGITGDLVKRKILHALFDLYQKNLLPKKFQVIGFSRRDWNDSQLREYLLPLLKDEVPVEKKNEFLEKFFYVNGDFDVSSSYTSLASKLGRVDGEWNVCSNKLFYLAVPPSSYRQIVQNLKDSGLTIPCSPEEGWTRVILEKPFGENLEAAKDLDNLLGELFKEEQIYRVDHYLGKETVRNILAFRFANTFLRHAFDNSSVARIEIQFFEELTVSERADFYDAIGALRDVGQNHILQLLALFTMKDPGELTAEKIHKSRQEVLSELRPMTEDEIMTHTIHGQYDGYLEEKGVNADSITETYFKVACTIDSPSWTGVPIILESGKGMNEEKVIVRIIFKELMQGASVYGGKQCQNVLTYEIQPTEHIHMSFLVKKPGHENFLEEKQFQFDYKEAFSEDEFIGAYEKLILDMIKGDQTLFVSTQEIVSEWNFVEPILRAWKKNVPQLFTYKKGDIIDKSFIESPDETTQKKIGIVGLGKMGGNMTSRLLSKEWEVYGYNRTPEKGLGFAEKNFHFYSDVKKMIDVMKSPRVILLSLPAGNVVDEMLFSENGIVSHLQKGDIIADFGNSFYLHSKKRGEKLLDEGINFIDVGISGGPEGALTGACLMIGGDRKTYEYLSPLFLDLAQPRGIAFFEGYGAGHFVKMIHNGIEYGMMQAIAEGFTILKNSDYEIDLTEVARIYNTGSVIESRLINWLYDGYKLFGSDLKTISGEVASTGEGEWTVEEAKKKHLPIKIIEESFLFRKNSQGNPSYTGQVVSLLRYMFGGHNVSK